MRMRSVRILFVNNLCGFWGGVERVIADTAKGLTERGHSCALAFGGHTQGSDSFSGIFRQTYHCFDLGPDSSGSISFDDAITSFAPDVVFIHKVDIPQYMTRRGYGLRCVQFVHDHDIYCATGYKYYRFSGKACTHRLGPRCWLDLGFVKRTPTAKMGVQWVGIQRKLLRQTGSYNLILANSHYVEKQLVDNGVDQDKIRVLHPVIAGGLPEYSRMPDEPHILYVGQLIRGKGVDLLLRALSKCQTDFRAEVLGVGNAESDLRRLSKKLALDDRVSFEGWLDREALRAKYERAKVCVVPSRWPEPFGLVGQEAMRHARPVVAFDVGGIQDWLEHEQTGLLVPEQDINGFAHALDRILRDTDYSRRLGDNAYTRVQEKFSFENFIDQLEQHLAGT